MLGVLTVLAQPSLSWSRVSVTVGRDLLLRAWRGCRIQRLCRSSIKKEGHVTGVIQFHVPSGASTKRSCSSRFGLIRPQESEQKKKKKEEKVKKKRPFCDVQVQINKTVRGRCQKTRPPCLRTRARPFWHSCLCKKKRRKMGSYESRPITHWRLPPTTHTHPKPSLFVFLAPVRPSPEYPEYPLSPLPCQGWAPVSHPRLCWPYWLPAKVCGTKN